MVKNLPATQKTHRRLNQKTQVHSLGWEDPLEKRMATHSGILAWKIPWTEKPGKLHAVHGVTDIWTQKCTEMVIKSLFTLVSKHH